MSENSDPKKVFCSPVAGFHAPKVNVGDIVLWAQRGGKPDAPAVVTKINAMGINVSVLADQMRVIHPMLGARHVSDPSVNKMLETPGGVWDLTETGKVLQGLQS